MRLTVQRVSGAVTAIEDYLTQAYPRLGPGAPWLVHHGAVRRTVFVGAAWLLVTAVSILVAYAAVGEVRDRVADQPRLLSVAASTVTTSTTTSTTSTTLTTATDAPTGPSTTLASTTSSTAVTSQTTTPTSSATTTTTTSVEEGRIETYSTPGGSVSIEIFPDRMRLLGAVPAAGFSVAEQEIAPTKIEIEFKSSAQEVHFHAELQPNGEVDVETETENE